ncbi:copper chaperone PCu(A)C [Thalassotalea euphylliae]|uniref:copper chaperone PCu(A)C n=1 Tax=Thalassotalea euphylliae TaxID=1655234 RepID=UPI003639589B
MNIFRQLCCAFVGLVTSASIFAQSVSVENGYIREVIPGNKITSAYMQIHNGTEQNKKLVAAKSAEIPRIEIHEHVMEDGMMKMGEVAFIEIPAGEMVELEPMGLHLMMFDIEQPVKAGHNITVTLVFEDKKTLDVLLPVKSLKKAKSSHHHHH